MWTLTDRELPPEGVPVETKVDDAEGCRSERKLILKNGLWWLLDGSTYVYYRPTHWR